MSKDKPSKGQNPPSEKSANSEKSISIPKRFIEKYVNEEYPLSEILGGNPPFESLLEVLLLLNPTFFVESLKNSPKLIERPAFKRVIHLLRVLCYGTGQEAKEAKELLKKAGISIFIPKEAKGKRTEHPALRRWQLDPQKLLELVKNREDKINPFLKKEYPTIEWKDKQNDIAKAYKAIYNKLMPKNLFFGERDKELTTIALTFIHDEYKVPYNTLRDLYFEQSKKFKTPK